MPHVGLPITQEKKEPIRDLNPMLLSILMMMVQKSMEKDEDEDKDKLKKDAQGNLQVNSGFMPFVSGVGT